MGGPRGGGEFDKMIKWDFNAPVLLYSNVIKACV